MPGLPELVAQMKKDPVRAFIGIPIASAAAPNKSKVIAFKTGKGEIYNKIQLPVWSGADWAWWGTAALSFAERTLAQEGVMRGGRSEKSVQSALENFRPFYDQMLTVGNAVPPDDLIAKFYDRAVRVVIQAKNVRKWESFVEQWLGDTFTTMPITPKESIQWLVRASGDALAAIAREAGKIASKVAGGLLAGLSAPVIVIGGYLLWRWWEDRDNNRRRYDDGEEA